ncbi:DMT family transporter [Psychromonas antarctica]|uniref:DMT family transporter n=1 Tax=Psychromonas antarctica TaxID=67573 RepID=UPI001EE851BA|nr:DMT family transporter [Psychromonas antarctica]MCG6202313.1 DMT family transporter [Psychromonas antarctica]
MLKTILLTALALLAFAGNSVLCRLALYDGVIDAASFTSIRLLSGIVFLLFLVAMRTKGKINLRSGSWLSAFFLFLYAIAFSYSYISVDTGTGALILFASVQGTMIVYGLLKGQRLLCLEWVGLFAALLGLFVLLMPGASAPSLMGFALMSISGIAWGGYTLAGKGSKTPLLDTTNNFLRTLPFIVLLTILTLQQVQISNQGLMLAIVSGAVTSGLGYAIWYSALARLTVTQAATIQLTVPIIATFGGVLFSNEMITIKLIISSILVLGGVLVVTLGKRYVKKKMAE